jgi:hypothetical protein
MSRNPTRRPEQASYRAGCHTWPPMWWQPRRERSTFDQAKSGYPAAFPERVNQTISQEMTLDLTDDEKAALVAHLMHAGLSLAQASTAGRRFEYAPFPYAPRLDPLKAILAKLEPPAPRAEPLPPLKPGMTPRRGLPISACGAASTCFSSTT